MNNQTLEKLRGMRLYGMHDAFKTSLENTLKEQMTQDQFVFHLVSNEWDNRRNRAIERAIRCAQFRYNATLEEIDYTFERGLDRNQVERLAALEFIREHKDLFITGPTGTGKSYLARVMQ
jgi:DNA replication protein DnaC